MRRRRRHLVTVAGIRVDRALLSLRSIRRCDPRACRAYCCGGGVAVGLGQAAEILANAPAIAAALPPERRDPGRWFVRRREPERDHPAGGMRTATAVVDDPTHPTGSACVFLRRDRKCALQVASTVAGHDPWRWKPLYCALHPLGFERGVLGLAERNAMYRDGGRCHRPAGRRVALHRLFARELRWLLGERGHAALARLRGGTP